MADSIRFSDVQLLNLSFLFTIQASIRKDPVAASYKFKLSAEQAPKVAALPPEKIQAVVANLGHECLFTPRHDLLQLMEAPPGLLRPLAIVRDSQSLAAASMPLDRRRNGNRT